MFLEGNNYAFIDSQNVNLSIRDQGWKLDWRRFRIFLYEKYHARKAFLFIGYIPNQRPLYNYLRHAGYIIIFKPTLAFSDGTVKGNVDAELVLHAMIQYLNYQKAIVVSGDGDFHCLVEYLIQQNKFGRLVIPNMHKYSALLRKFIPRAEFMSRMRSRLEKTKEGH